METSAYPETNHRKRRYSDATQRIIDSTYPLPNRTRKTRSQRTSRSKITGYATTSSYEQLNDHYNFIVDVEDILEEYLVPQTRESIIPLTVNTDEGDWSVVPEYEHPIGLLKPGISVKLRNGMFLMIEEILQDFDSSHVVIRGQRLLRTSRLRPILDLGGTNTRQELFLDLMSIKGSQLSVREQSTIDVPVEWMDKMVNIHFSNADPPRNSSRSGDYFCRWKLSRQYKNLKDERRATEIAIERLSEMEAVEDYRITDKILKRLWRGLGDSNDSADNSNSSTNNYTALDGFCCGGGWSRGATMAGGIDIVRSFDKDARACSTYSVNFPKTKCLNLDVFDYCNSINQDPAIQQAATNPRFIDIAHYSTPCQFFSPAHTREGRNDEANFAASFCLGPLLDKDRPRIMTFENTAGLERRHFDTLKAIFGQVTSRGYSLRFTCLALADYGLAQKRQRLVMLASCPGEPLPTFPKPTHSKHGHVEGTQSWVEIVDVLDCIPFNGWQNHNPSAMPKKVPTKYHKQAPTMTCAGGSEVLHPSGRHYTLCESQLIQGFPLHHRFAPKLKRTIIRAQIGNAFPPLFVKQLLRHIRRQMQTTDGIPHSVDADEFMSDEEIRDEEVAQFFRDHEQLPAGTRANIQFLDEEGDNEDEEWEDESFALESEPALDWSWITGHTATNTANLRGSNQSSWTDPSRPTSSFHSSRSSSITFAANPRSATTSLLGSPIDTESTNNMNINTNLIGNSHESSVTPDYANLNHHLSAADLLSSRNSISAPLNTRFTSNTAKFPFGTSFSTAAAGYTPSAARRYTGYPSLPSFPSYPSAKQPSASSSYPFPRLNRPSSMHTHPSATAHLSKPHHIIGDDDGNDTHAARGSSSFTVPTASTSPTSTSPAASKAPRRKSTIAAVVKTETTPTKDLDTRAVRFYGLLTPGKGSVDDPIDLDG